MAGLIRFTPASGGGRAAPKAAPKTAPRASSSGGGLIRFAPAASAATKAAPKQNQNFLMKALNVLDKPGAVVRNTVFEGIDLLEGRGFSGRDLLKGVGPLTGSGRSTADYLKETGSDLPGWARAGLGFASDVVLDPLTYVGGAGLLRQGAKPIARQLLNPEVVAKLASRNITPAMAHQAAGTAVRQGAARVDPKILSALAEVTAKPGARPLTSQPGVYIGLGKQNRVRIPGLDRLAQTTNDINVNARKAFLNTKTGEAISKRLGGKAGELVVPGVGGRGDSLLKAMRTAKTSEDAVTAFQHLETARWGDRIRKGAESELLDDLDKVLKPFKGSADDLTDMRRALEGDTEAVARLAAKPLGDGRTMLDEVGGVRAWLDVAGARAQLPRIQNYFPRTWSKELREELRESIRSGSKDISPAMKRELVDGTEWMGEVLRGTPAEIRDQIERLVKQVHGPDAHLMFSDDVVDVLTGYAKQVARREANLGMQDELIRRLGEVKRLPPKAKQQKRPRGYKPPKPGRKPVGSSAGPPPPNLLGGAAAAPTSNPVAKAAALRAKAMEMEPYIAAQTDNAVIARMKAQVDDLMRQADEIEQGVAAPPASVTDANLQAARQIMEDVNRSVLRSAENTDKWQSQIVAVEKTINRLEDRLAKQFKRTGEMDEGLQSRINDLYAERDRMQTRLDLADRVLTSDQGVAKSLFDSAQTAAERAAQMADQADRARALQTAIDENAAALFQLFPGDGRSMQAIRTALLKRDDLSKELTGAARRLADGRNVGEVVDVLQSVGRMPQGGKLLQQYDRINQILKQYMILSPGFHIRNAFGGEFNNMLAGVDMSSRLEWARIWNKSRWGADPDRLNRAQREIYDRVTSTRTFGQTQTSDVAGAARSGVSGNPLASNFAPVQLSHKVSGATEGYLRGTVAYDVLKKSGGGNVLQGSVDDAADQVIKFHYDYDDLSGFERGVMKRIIPFYTWTRKNLPLQLEQMGKQPAKYTAYLKAKDNIESLSDPEDVVPGYFGDLGSIRMPGFLGEGRAYWSPDLPFRDISEYVRPDEPFAGARMAIGSVTPIIKVPFERWAGKRYFTDSPFYPGHSKAPGSWSAIPGLMPALAAIGLADKGVDGYYMDQRNAYTVGQVVPVLARLQRVAPSGEGDEFMKQRQASNVLSFFGLGVQANTPEAQKAELKKRTKALNAAAKKAKDLGYTD